MSIPSTPSSEYFYDNVAKQIYYYGSSKHGSITISSISMLNATGNDVWLILGGIGRTQLLAGDSISLDAVLGAGAPVPSPLPTDWSSMPVLGDIWGAVGDSQVQSQPIYYPSFIHGPDTTIVNVQVGPVVNLYAWANWPLGKLWMVLAAPRQPTNIYGPTRVTNLSSVPVTLSSTTLVAPQTLYTNSEYSTAAPTLASGTTTIPLSQTAAMGATGAYASLFLAAQWVSPVSTTLPISVTAFNPLYGQNYNGPTGAPGLALQVIDAKSTPLTFLVVNASGATVTLGSASIPPGESQSISIANQVPALPNFSLGSNITLKAAEAGVIANGVYVNFLTNELWVTPAPLVILNAQGPTIVLAAPGFVSPVLVPSTLYLTNVGPGTPIVLQRQLPSVVCTELTCNSPGAWLDNPTLGAVTNLIRIPQSTTSTPLAPEITATYNSTKTTLVVTIGVPVASSTPTTFADLVATVCGTRGFGNCQPIADVPQGSCLAYFDEGPLGAWCATAAETSSTSLEAAYAAMVTSVCNAPNAATDPACACVLRSTTTLALDLGGSQPQTLAQFLSAAGPTFPKQLAEATQCWWPACQGMEGALRPPAMVPCTANIANCYAAVNDIVVTGGATLSVDLSNVCSAPSTFQLPSSTPWSSYGSSFAPGPAPGPGPGPGPAPPAPAPPAPTPAALQFISKHKVLLLVGFAVVVLAVALVIGLTAGRRV